MANSKAAEGLLFQVQVLKILKARELLDTVITESVAEGLERDEVLQPGYVAQRLVPEVTAS